jgi:hypothetical protein
VLNVKTFILAIILLFSIVGTGYVEVRSQEQSSIVHDGNYVGLEKMPNISPDDPHASWFHENTLVVRNDEAILDEVPVVFHGGKKEYSASDGGFMTFRAKFVKKDGEPVVTLRMCQSDYIAVRVPVNPEERQGPYKEIKTYPLKLNSGRIEFNGVTYKIAKVHKNELDRLVDLLHTEPMEKK